MFLEVEQPPLAGVCIALFADDVLNAEQHLIYIDRAKKHRQLIVNGVRVI
jgi:hypothetical protein